jgi:hypothetical protein
MLLSMDRVEHRPLRKRAWHAVRGILADGTYATLLAIPVAVGVAAYTFVYLSLLRHRLNRRAEQALADRMRATPDAGDE